LSDINVNVPMFVSQFCPVYPSAHLQV